MDIEVELRHYLLSLLSQISIGNISICTFRFSKIALCLEQANKQILCKHLGDALCQKQHSSYKPIQRNLPENREYSPFPNEQWALYTSPSRKERRQARAGGLFSLHIFPWTRCSREWPFVIDIDWKECFRAVAMTCRWSDVGSPLIDSRCSWNSISCINLRIRVTFAWMWDITPSKQSCNYFHSQYLVISPASWNGCMVLRRWIVPHFPSKNLRILNREKPLVFRCTTKE